MELRWIWICYGHRRKIGQSFAGLLVMFLSLAAGLAQEPKAHFVGSESCRRCHHKVYNGWKQTRMANVVRDPEQHPDAVLGDFTHPDPVRTFELKDVAFVYGSRWKQRYFAQRGNDYFVLPAQWDVKKKKWLPYHVEAGTDWWVPFYRPSNFERPTGPPCDGCHSVNYDVETKQVTEWNVGCEKCHGPGSLHVAHPTRANIVNPKSSTTCAETTSACSATPRAAAQATDRRQVLRLACRLFPGDRLADYWQLEELKPGTQISINRPTSPPTRTGCKETISSRAPCITARCAASTATMFTATRIQRILSPRETRSAWAAIRKTTPPD